MPVQTEQIFCERSLQSKTFYSKVYQLQRSIKNVDLSESTNYKVYFIVWTDLSVMALINCFISTEGRAELIQYFFLTSDMDDLRRTAHDHEAKAFETVNTPNKLVAFFLLKISDLCIKVWLEL